MHPSQIEFLQHIADECKYLLRESYTVTVLMILKTMNAYQKLFAEAWKI